MYYTFFSPTTFGPEIHLLCCSKQLSCSSTAMSIKATNSFLAVNSRCHLPVYRVRWLCFFCFSFQGFHPTSLPPSAPRFQLATPPPRFFSSEARPEGVVLPLEDMQHETSQSIIPKKKAFPRNNNETQAKKKSKKKKIRLVCAFSLALSTSLFHTYETSSLAQTSFVAFTTAAKNCCPTTAAMIPIVGVAVGTLGRIVSPRPRDTALRQIIH